MLQAAHIVKLNSVIFVYLQHYIAIKDARKWKLIHIANRIWLKLLIIQSLHLKTSKSYIEELLCYLQ